MSRMAAAWRSSVQSMVCMAVPGGSCVHYSRRIVHDPEMNPMASRAAHSAAQQAPDAGGVDPAPEPDATGAAIDLLIAERVLGLRLARGLSLAGLAGASGVSKAMI